MNDRIKMDLKEKGWEVDKNGSVSSQIVGFVTAELKLQILLLERTGRLVEQKLPSW